VLNISRGFALMTKHVLIAYKHDHDQILYLDKHMQHSRFNVMFHLCQFKVILSLHAIMNAI
jgi:hypothetical protein